MGGGGRQRESAERLLALSEADGGTVLRTIGKPGRNLWHSTDLPEEISWQFLPDSDGYYFSGLVTVFQLL